MSITPAATTSLPTSPIAPASSLREQVEKEIAAGIASGLMAPGEVFSAPMLAARYGVSATPVREAMINLEKRGLVEIVRNKGFRVTEVSEADLRAIVDVRQLLEVPAVGRLAGQLSKSQLRTLERLAGAIVTSAAKGKLAPYLQADTAFHLTLLEHVGNPRLVSIVSDLRSQTRLTGLANLVGSSQLQASAQEHLQLLTLLSDGDRQGAEALMSRHIQHILGWWAGQPEEA